jgi:hypothetical protein
MLVRDTKGIAKAAGSHFTADRCKSQERLWMPAQELATFTKSEVPSGHTADSQQDHFLPAMETT